MFSLQYNWRRGQNRFCLKGGDVGGRVGAEIMYITGNKCRNYKMKMEKKKNLFKYI
jgi:hypothetical protein